MVRRVLPPPGERGVTGGPTHPPPLPLPGGGLATLKRSLVGERGEHPMGTTVGGGRRTRVIGVWGGGGGGLRKDSGWG